MRALSVRQPWAWAIIYAGKDIENRSWSNKYSIGTIAIHASTRMDSLDDLPRGIRRPEPEELVRGAIIGVVDVVDVVVQHESKWFSGPMGWVLQNPYALPEPLYCAGKLGLWRIPPEFERTIRRQLANRGWQS